MIKVLSNSVFRCLKTDVQNPPHEKKTWSNIDLIAWLEQKCAPTQLGISPLKLPDRHWLVTLAYSFEPNLEIFTGAETKDELVSLPLRLLNKFKFYDPFIKPCKKGLLKKSEEHKRIEKRDILLKRRAKKERRFAYLESEAKKVNADISEIDCIYSMNNDEDI